MKEGDIDTDCFVGFGWSEASVVVEKKSIVLLPEVQVNDHRKVLGVVRFLRLKSPNRSRSLNHEGPEDMRLTPIRHDLVFVFP